MSPNWSRRFVCAAGLVLLVGWQLLLFRQAWPERYTFKAASGMAEQDKFVYFLYYTGLFPVASTNNGLNYYFYYTKAAVPRQPNTLEYSPPGAQATLRTQGKTLVMEWGHTIRSGQLLSTFLFLPDAWRLGSPEHAEVRMTHGALFIASLAAVYLMSWYVNRPVFGTLFVLLVGSNPFQLYEAYRHENVFSWPITALCFMLALALPLLVKPRISIAYAVGAAIVAGAFASTLAQIRPEPITLLGGVAFAFLGATSLALRVRLGLVGLLVVTAALGARAWNAYFDGKFEEAARVVAASGGRVLSGHRDHYHVFWHPIWCGLGDFGQDHGYDWNDSAALAYAQPILRARYGQELPWWWGVQGKEEHDRTADDFVDAGRTYYRIPYNTPHYDEVIRDKVLGDIRHDPMWYAGVLGRRARRLLTETTRPQVTLSPGVMLPLPFSGVLVVPFALALGLFRRWADLKILLFSCAGSVPALLVFSGRGMTHYSVYHLCALALLASWLVEAGRRRPATMAVTGDPSPA